MEFNGDGAMGFLRQGRHHVLFFAGIGIPSWENF